MIVVQCMWVDRQGGLDVNPPSQCAKRATRFTQEWDGVCWAWCEQHNKKAGHYDDEKPITEQEYLVQSVQNS